MLRSELKASLVEYAPFVKRIAGYSLGGAAVKSVSFLMLPILTRVFSPSQYGALDVVIAAQGIAQVIAGLNLETAVARYYYEFDAYERSRFLGTVVTMLCVSGLAEVLIMAALARSVSTIIFGNPGQWLAVVLCAVTVPLSNLLSVILTVLRFQDRAREYVHISLGVSIAQFAFTIGMLSLWRRIDIVFGAQLCSLLIGLTVAWIRLREPMTLGVSREMVRKSAMFALPQLPSVLISWYLVSANRFFLIGSASLLEVAKLAVASKVNSVVLVLTQAFVLAWKPFAMKVIQRPDARRLYANVMYGSVIALSVVCVVVTLAAPLFLRFYAGPIYSTAALPAAILVLSTCIGHGFGWIFGIGLEITGHTFSFSIAQVATFAVTTAGNIALIPRWGAEGAALAVLLGTVAQVASVRLLCNRYYRLPYSKAIWAAPATAAALMWGAWGLGAL